jgi:excisionase family DNA binding protein
MNNTEKVLLTVPQAAEELNVTCSCLRRWILERRISVIRLGRLVRISQAELDRLIATGLRPARPAR